MGYCIAMLLIGWGLSFMAYYIKEVKKHYLTLLGKIAMNILYFFGLTVGSLAITLLLALS